MATATYKRQPHHYHQHPLLLLTTAFAAFATTANVVDLEPAGEGGDDDTHHNTSMPSSPCLPRSLPSRES